MMKSTSTTDLEEIRYLALFGYDHQVWLSQKKEENKRDTCAGVYVRNKAARCFRT